MAVTATVNATISHTNTKVLDQSTAQDSLTLQISKQFTNGTGIDKANLVYAERVTIAASATHTWDIYDLSFDGGAARKDALGQTWTAAKVRGLAVKNRSTTAGDILTLFGGADDDAWTPILNGLNTAKVTLGPDGLFLVTNPSAAGYAVDAAEERYLRIINTVAREYAYDIWILAESV